MAAEKFKVLVSGAGIAGPCVAYWLAKAQHDIEITIVERSPSPRVTGQAIDIRGPAIEVMKKMNLEEAVRARSTTEEGTMFVNASGKAFAKFQGGSNFTAEYEILRADLSELFLEATQQFSNIKYIYGDYVESLEESEDEITATFAKGSKVTYDLIVGADGSTSKIRTMILDHQTIKDGYNMLGQYIAFFSIPRLPSDDRFWRWCSLSKGLAYMTRPHRNPATMGAYLSVTTPGWNQKYPDLEHALESGGTNESKRVLHKYFANAGEESKRILESMDAAKDFYMSRTAQVRLPQWTKGRVVLLGDAAFATMGIATSLAIESSYVLAGEISKISSSKDVPKALTSFESIFRKYYEKIGSMPRFFPQAFCPQTSWGLWIRNALIWLLCKSRIYKVFQHDQVLKWDLPSYVWVDSGKASLSNSSGESI